MCDFFLSFVAFLVSRVCQSFVIAIVLVSLIVCMMSHVQDVLLFLTQLEQV